MEMEALLTSKSLRALFFSWDIMSSEAITPICMERQATSISPPPIYMKPRSCTHACRRRAVLKQVQAGRLLGRSLKQVADLHLKLKHGSKAQGAETALREAVQVLEVGGVWRCLEAVQVLPSPLSNCPRGSVRPTLSAI
jgi:hypothetical protein